MIRIDKNRLKDGVNFLKSENLIVYKADHQDTFKVFENKCKHAGGKFIPNDKCNKHLTCPIHGWVLDAESLEYVNPSGLHQTELSHENTQDALLIKPISDEFNFNFRDKDLSKNNISIEFITHACVVINCNGIKIATDPWVIGPAFLTGWWTAHYPPENWRTTLAECDYIYVSHNHSDHLNEHTLLEVWKMNPDMKFLVPPFADQSVEKSLKRIGFKNLISCAFGEWKHLSSDVSVMLLIDGAGRSDSGLLIDVNGYKILNSVDCSNINSGILPQIDVLLTAFASGASGFPVCWEEMYSLEKIKGIVDRNRKHELAYAIGQIKKTNPEIIIPFAGYFAELHPDDKEVRELNIKNSPHDLKVAVNNNFADKFVWIPESGDRLSLKDKKVVKTSVGFEKDKNIPEYDRQISSFVKNHLPEDRLAFLQKYMDWTGYANDHLVQIVLTTNDFKTETETYWFDFLDKKVFSEQPASSRKQFSRFKIRYDKFYYTVLRGLPWEELSIGFQMKFFREPDVYEFEFWNHFQNNLPEVLMPEQVGK